MIDVENYPLFKKYTCDLKTTSKDDYGNTLCSSTKVKAINFDLVKKAYCKDIFGKSIPALRSNDALVLLDAKVDEEKTFLFIEFKNCQVDENDLDIEKIKTKISDSLLIFNDIIDKNLKFTRTNVNYILVYSKKKNSRFESYRNDGSLKEGIRILGKLAGDKLLVKGFTRYKLFFHKVDTLNEIEFREVEKQLEKKTYVF